jgi:hypothetical protein
MSRNISHEAGSRQRTAFSLAALSGLGALQGDRILHCQQSQQGAALVDDSRADNEIPLKPPIYVVTGD